jgi:hypothetical protein
MTISQEDTLHDLLPGFYKKYGLDEDGGLSDSKVKIEFSKHIFLYIPNSSARKKVVLKHDIHHIITGYPSDMKGETEIGAWEVASGCKNYWIAWALNLYGMVMGVWFNLPGVYRAFVRGRRSRNLYSNRITEEQALAMHADELRNLLSIPSYHQKLRSNFADLFFFLTWLLIGLIYGLASIVLLPPVIVYNIFLFSRRKKKQ